MGKPFLVSRLFVDTVDMSEEIIRRYVRHHEKMEQNKYTNSKWSC